MQSPCVGFCSTTFGDPICRGCKRTSQEVDSWNLMTPEQQAAVWHRLWQQQQQLVPRYIKIFDAKLLKQQLERHGLRHHPQAPAEAWVIDLLRAGCQHLRKLSAYGLEPTSDAAHLSPVDLFNRLNQELLTEK